MLPIKELIEIASAVTPGNNTEYRNYVELILKLDKKLDALQDKKNTSTIFQIISGNFKNKQYPHPLMLKLMLPILANIMKTYSWDDFGYDSSFISTILTSPYISLITHIEKASFYKASPFYHAFISCLPYNDLLDIYGIGIKDVIIENPEYGNIDLLTMFIIEHGNIKRSMTPCQVAKLFNNISILYTPLKIIKHKNLNTYSYLELARKYYCPEVELLCSKK